MCKMRKNVLRLHFKRLRTFTRDTQNFIKSCNVFDDLDRENAKRSSTQKAPKWRGKLGRVKVETTLVFNFGISKTKITFFKFLCLRLFRITNPFIIPSS